MIDVVMIRLGVRHPTERPESLGVWMLVLMVRPESLGVWMVVLMVLWMRTKSLESSQPYAVCGIDCKTTIRQSTVTALYNLRSIAKQTWYLRALTNNLLDRARQREALRR